MSDYLKRRDIIAIKLTYEQWSLVLMEMDVCEHDRGPFPKDDKRWPVIGEISRQMRLRDERRMPPATSEQRASLLQFVNKRVLPRDPTPPPRRRRGDRHH